MPQMKHETKSVQDRLGRDMESIAALQAQARRTLTPKGDESKTRLTTAIHSRKSDEWRTPVDFYAALDAEFHFTLDAAATADNAMCATYLDREEDALVRQWNSIPSHRPGRPVVWCNPPYSLITQFIQKAEYASRHGCTVVCLVPSRTDTRWWHTYVWDQDHHAPRTRVEVRFLKGRLKFGDGTGTAPFPSALVIFRSPLPTGHRPTA
jgi:phage N-6-adenine-methyltransferase